MTIRQTTRNVLRRAQSEATQALASIATKYGLNVKATPEYTSAYETSMKVVVAIPPYKERARDDRKIVVIKKRNPHRPGSKRAAMFEALKQSATVAEFRTKGYYPSYLTWAAKSSLIKLR
jgi:hypothetical protein